MDPSPWMRRFVPPAERYAEDASAPQPCALDLACGSGRHTRLLRQRGYRVVAVDRDLSRLDEPEDEPGVERIETDLEDGGAFPLAGRQFALVLVSNYLHRPLLDALARAVAPGGRLLYETFTVRQPAYGRPSNPDWLLEHGELLEIVRGRLRVVAFEDLVDGEPPVTRQRLCADSPAV